MTKDEADAEKEIRRREDSNSTFLTNTTKMTKQTTFKKVVRWWEKSKLNSVSAYAIIYSFAFNFNLGKAQLSMLNSQGAQYFESRKINFAIIEKIRRPPYRVLG